VSVGRTKSLWNDQIKLSVYEYSINIIGNALIGIAQTNRIAKSIIKADILRLDLTINSLLYVNFFLGRENKHIESITLKTIDNIDVEALRKQSSLKHF